MNRVDQIMEKAYRKMDRFYEGRKKRTKFDWDPILRDISIKGLTKKQATVIAIIYRQPYYSKTKGFTVNFRFTNTYGYISTCKTLEKKGLIIRKDDSGHYFGLTKEGFQIANKNFEDDDENVQEPI